ncbi:MAG TPA: hypothetical protein VHE35_37470 [Kofleriaceae bacterium]|nr:hypothetical protein [Kofleriaceae bacterium]
MRRTRSLSLTLAGLLIIPALAACGGDDGGGSATDAGVDGLTNEGFPVPTAVTKANDEVDGVWTEIGDADWSCLNTPSTDAPSTQNVMLSGKIRDFQTSSNGVANATITAFPGIMLSGNSGMATSDATAANKGNYSMTLTKLPAGQTRYGFKIDAPTYMRTYLLNQYFDPTMASQTRDISAVSIGTANAVIAFVGEQFDNTTGTLAGAFRDCQGHEVSNAVATVSSTSGTVTHLPGADTFYFSAASSSLPVRHNVSPTMNKDGLFVVIDLPPQQANAYIQIWGFRTAAELASGQMTLLSELASPVEANAIITGSIEPKRQ